MNSLRSALAALRDWCRTPRLTWWLIALAVALVALRKPWSLHTPQFHAEDGEIFMLQDDQMGLRAIMEPYMGYLHLIPRLVAWIASHTADVAWWPAIYNGAALLVTAALFLRLASPRLDLPGKPWLALAFPLAAHTGEVLLNLTNLQWLTAFLLLLQVLMARPTTWTQRAGDLAIVVLVGLTGPFSLVFLPLFAWRAWRERHADSFALLALVAACGAVQAWFVVKTGTRFDYQSQPLHPLMLFGVLGSRLAVWPVFGAAVARALPVIAHAAIGGAILAALGVWCLRPHPRRLLRLQVLAALSLITLACVYRLRPDTWETANLENGDRYFFVPRVLLAWLLIWEFDAVPRFVAVAARLACLAAVLTSLPHHMIPAPPDYRWAEHCDSIRRGVPAKINTLPAGWWIDYPGRAAKP